MNPLVSYRQAILQPSLRWNQSYNVICMWNVGQNHQSENRQLPKWLRAKTADDQGLSRYLETGCPNRGFIDFCVSKVWYKIHTTNKIDPITLQILLFRPDTALCVLLK